MEETLIPAKNTILAKYSNYIVKIIPNQIKISYFY